MIFFAIKFDQYVISKKTSIGPRDYCADFAYCKFADFAPTNSAN